MNIEDRLLYDPNKIILKDKTSGEIKEYEIQDDKENVAQEGSKINSLFFNELILEIKKELRPIRVFILYKFRKRPSRNTRFW